MGKEQVVVSDEFQNSVEFRLEETGIEMCVRFAEDTDTSYEITREADGTRVFKFSGVADEDLKYLYAKLGQWLGLEGA